MHVLYVACICNNLYTVRGKILEGENFGESLLTNQMARKILANQLAGLQLFHCIYNYWRGKIWRFVHHSPKSPKFSPSKFFPRTVCNSVGCCSIWN